MERIDSIWGRKMRKKILAVASAALFLAFAALLWRLDIPHWKKLDLDRIHGIASAT